MSESADCFWSIRKLCQLVLGVVVAAACTLAGAMFNEQYARWEVLAPERAVAGLPGVGEGWLDTLRRVAGDVRIDTISRLMVASEGQFLLGVHESWHNTISIRTEIRAYTRFLRGSTCLRSFEYQHPTTITHPAGVVAHEFGHRFEVSLWPHGDVREGGDSLPTFAQGNRERFADRFSRAMLALRGWDDPDSTDAVLNHRVWYLLWRSYQ